METVEAVFKKAEKLPTRSEIMEDIYQLTIKAQTLFDAESATRTPDPILICVLDMLTLFGSTVLIDDKRGLALFATTMTSLKAILMPVLVKNIAKILGKESL